MDFFIGLKPLLGGITRLVDFFIGLHPILGGENARFFDFFIGFTELYTTLGTTSKTFSPNVKTLIDFFNFFDFFISGDYYIFFGSEVSG